MTDTDLITQKVLQLTDMVTNALIAAAPKAQQVVLATAKISAINNLILPIFLFSLTIMLLFSIPFFLKYRKKCVDKNEKELYELAILLAFGFSAVLMLLSVYNGLFDVFSWVGIWHPEIYLTHELMQQVLS